MFEDFEAMITGLVNSVKAGASNTWDSIGLKSKIESAKKDIAKIYGDIGEKFYTENKDSIPEGYEESFELVKEKFDLVDGYLEQVKKIAGIRTCPECGADVSKDYRYCTTCGAKMPEEKAAPKVKYICPECGAEAEEGAVFCTNCGTKITTVEEKKPENVCKRCGAKLVTGAKFCTTCGLKIEELEKPEECCCEEAKEETAECCCEEAKEETAECCCNEAGEDTAGSTEA